MAERRHNFSGDYSDDANMVLQKRKGQEENIRQQAARMLNLDTRDWGEDDDDVSGELSTVSSVTSNAQSQPQPVTVAKRNGSRFSRRPSIPRFPNGLGKAIGRRGSLDLGATTISNGFSPSVPSTPVSSTTSVDRTPSPSTTVTSSSSSGSNGNPLLASDLPSPRTLNSNLNLNLNFGAGSLGPSPSPPASSTKTTAAAAAATSEQEKGKEKEKEKGKATILQVQEKEKEKEKEEEKVMLNQPRPRPPPRGSKAGALNKIQQLQASLQAQMDLYQPSVTPIGVENTPIGGVRSSYLQAHWPQTRS
eukprot:g55984.t1